MNSAEVLIKFKGDTKDADSAIKDQESKLDGLKKKGEAAFAGMTAGADLLAGSIVKSGITYNAQIETYLTRLETLTGSAEEANKVLNQIKKDALATPFEVSSLTSAESLLLATGMSAEDARKDILALGDAISASGGGNEELSRMAVNLQQIKNVGKASALDIKQFAYAGIDIYGLLADSMGITREEAAQLDVSYDMLSTALQKASSEGGKYYGAMEKQSKTYNGAMSNLSESLQVLKGELAKGIFKAVKKLIPVLTKMADWLGKNHKIVEAIAIPLLTFLNVLTALMVAKKVALAIKALVLVLNTPIGMVALISAIVVAIIYLWNNCEAFRNFFINMWNTIKNVVDTTIGFIVGLFEGIVDFVKNNWQGLLLLIVNPFAGAFKLLYDNFSGFRNFIDGIMNGIKSTINTVANFFGTAFNKAKTTVEGIFNNIKTTAETIIGGIVEVIKTPINFLIDGINLFIKALNKIKIPNWVPKVGGKGLHFDKIPKLATGTNYVPEDTLAMIHQGEAVVPKKFNPYANGVNASSLNYGGKSQPIINIYADFKTDPLGQTVSNIKTFSGGAKNDYNYGVGV